MNKDFIAEVARKIKVKREDLIEKDLLLHLILKDLSKIPFSGEIAFKGGSCLIKHYLGYYRFSVDLDFTFSDQEIFKGVSQKQIRRILRERIGDAGKIFEEIAKKRGMEFKCDKEDKKFVQLGGSNKMVTFKLWFHSTLTGEEDFIKIQINFVEKILFRIKKVRLVSVCPDDPDLEFLFPDLYREYRSEIEFKVYDVKEIFCEKIRAILTRRGIKERDVIDVFIISKNFKIGAKGLEKEILEKTSFILDLYKKYREHLEGKRSLLKIENFSFGEEKYLLLKEIDKKEFYQFTARLMDYLQSLIGKVR